MPDMQPEPPAHDRLDLRGVKCPLNWARARVHLDELPAGAHLLLVVDDPRAVRDIPRAAEASGHAVGDLGEVEPGVWQIEILK